MTTLPMARRATIGNNLSLFDDALSLNLNRRFSLSSDSFLDYEAGTTVKNKSSSKFQKIFELDDTESLLKSFSCALVDEILFQGTLYVSAQFICFYSRIANKRKIIKVAITDLTDITREKTAGIIPNAIALHTKHERYLFASFMQRDTTYRCLVDLWQSRRTDSSLGAWFQPPGAIVDHDLAGVIAPEEHPDEDIFLLANEELELIAKVCKEKGEGEWLISQDLPITLPKDDSSQDEKKEENVSTNGTDNFSGILCNGGDSLTEIRCRSEPAPPLRSLSAPASTYTGPDAVVPDHRVRSPQWPSVSEILVDIWRLPRHQFYIFVAFIILIFLTILALVLAWRIHSFQKILLNRVSAADVKRVMEFDNSGYTQSPNDEHCVDDINCRLYYWRRETHAAEISRLQRALTNSVHLLDNLIQSYSKRLSEAYQDSESSPQLMRNSKV